MVKTQDGILAIEVILALIAWPNKIIYLLSLSRFNDG
jgi:hypothetical protein